MPRVWEISLNNFFCWSFLYHREKFRIQFCRKIRYPESYFLSYFFYFKLKVYGTEQAHAHLHLKKHIVNQSSALSIAVGDFNFVTEREDRITTSTGQVSTLSDEKETEWFQEQVWGSHGFHELRQPNFTHTSGLATWPPVGRNGSREGGMAM